MAKKNPTKTETPKKKPTKPLQLKVPGTERKAIAELDRAAENYRTARDERMEHTRIEKEKKVLLLETAKKYGISAYIYESEDGEEFEVKYIEKSAENVKVRKLKDEDDSDGDDD